MRILPFAPLLWASMAWAAPAPTPVAPPVVAPPPAPAGMTDAERATLEQMQAELKALQDQVAAQAAALDKQKADLEEQRAGLAADRKAVADNEPPFKLEVTGYYRVRGHLFGAGGEKSTHGGLFADQKGAATYMDQRLRVGLKFNYKNLASLNVGVQALDGVLFGDNASKERTSLFATDPSDTGLTGAEVANFQVFRAWTEARLPIGQIRIGRMTSTWGLGILANAGDGFDDDFGDNYYGNTYDRFLFGTNPVSIVQKITKKEETKEIPLTLAVAVDRLVEDPLVQYYGYKCNPGDVTGDEAYDARCDADGNGTTDLDHSWTENRDPSQRAANWWADPNDDVWEMVYALIYRGSKIKYFGGVGDLNVGTYIIQRLQKETKSNVVIADFYLDGKVHGVSLGFEGVGIFGNTHALTLPNSGADPIGKKAQIGGYVLRVGYEQAKWKVLWENGYASGDDDVTDGNFTGRALSPDYNVGLLLYEEVLARVSAAKWTGDASGLRSRGGVYNSHYIFPRVYGMPIDNLQVIGGFVMGFVDKPDGAVIRCSDKDVERGLNCTPTPGTKGPLGWEVDAAVKYKIQKHVSFSLEGGYAHTGNRIPVENVGLNPNGNFFTLQTRLAWEF